MRATEGRACRAIAAAAPPRHGSLRHGSLTWQHRDAMLARMLQAAAKTVLFLACYAVVVTAANVFLKLSADAGGVWPFLAFQAGGNLAGLAGVLLYTGLLRGMPLHTAFPLSRGVGVLGVQLAASLLVFHEAFKPTEAVGAVVVAAGIILVGMGAGRQENRKRPAGGGGGW